MSEINREEKAMSLRSPVNFDIVADNMLDIAEFTVEKYEFRNDTVLSAEMRENALKEIRNSLWVKVEEMRRRRKKILEEMFSLAEETLDEILRDKG
ncbi:MAG: hypothetical protein F4093_10890 [Gammaproteobacteria bacterium]|nr:hypothetical protein [Gammaproteobacteria bacterium]MYJ53133.1 hypothetical protein [Gammaproteobacteria bacterium]